MQAISLCLLALGASVNANAVPNSGIMFPWSASKSEAVPESMKLNTNSNNDTDVFAQVFNLTSNFWKEVGKNFEPKGQVNGTAKSSNSTR
ncbi:hypothetical protein DSO57_1034947 [Entomophthora muscae]|uniref:Uncharacterized protein n=1 Tax=Entomophthora muscae TaxID=34485 RepID=A0ACC2REE9_9FUNG|nr:hypothetical protein DSO57_1034947 [Entomophthora muscae]